MKNLKKFEDFVNEDVQSTSAINEYGVEAANKKDKAIEKAIMKVPHDNQVQREFKQSIYKAISTYLDESPDEMEETMTFMTILFNEIKHAR